MQNRRAKLQNKLANKAQPQQLFKIGQKVRLKLMRSPFQKSQVSPYTQNVYGVIDIKRDGPYVVYALHDFATGVPYSGYVDEWKLVPAYDDDVT